MNDLPVFYFGYGSLVNRATRPPEEMALPARLHGWHRSWTHRVGPVDVGQGNCSLNVIDLASGGSPEIASTAIDGVLVAIDAADLPLLDARESGYDRVSLSFEHIELLHGATIDMPSEAQIFLYRSDAEHEAPATEDYPILQSYIDCVMAGYRQYYGDQGLREFVASTDGWHGPILDDRPNPLYVRAQRLDGSLLQHFDSMLEPYCTAA